MRWFSSLVLKNAKLMAILGTLLAILGGYYSVELYKNLRTDIRELLPTTARSVVDLGEVTERLESIDTLSVLVLSENTQASKRFVQALAKKLKSAPKSTVASVEYKIDDEIQFFKERQALFIELADLKRIRSYIQDKIDYEIALRNPVNIFAEIEIPEPAFDFLALKKKYSGKTSGFDHFPEGYYATPDAKTRVLLVNLPAKISGYEGFTRLVKTVEKAVQELQPQAYSPDLQIKFAGGIEDAIEEQDALMADLELSTIIVTLIVAVGMLVYFRTIRATAALVLSLLMGTLWTFGASYFAVGYLNANSAFLGSIVLGNGINFGIIYLARYLEERRNGKDNDEATRLSFQFTATSTWTAALAAGLSYGSLMLTGFRGFNQFGLIGLIGMVLCWLSAFTVLPALLTVFEKFGPIIKPGTPEPKAILTGAVAFVVGKFPKAVWMVSVLITCLSVASFSRLSHSILETDLTQLRNKESIEHGSGYWSKFVDEQIFQHYLSPLVVLPKSRANALKIAEALKLKRASEGESSLIASVQTLDDFIPKDQAEKIQVLHEIKRLLPERLLQRLSSEDRGLVAEFLNPAVLKPMVERDLPPLLLGKFTERNGSIGKLVLVEPPLSQVTGDGLSLVRFIAEIRSAADSVEPGSAVAGAVAVSSDMLGAISADGPKATLFAFLSVIILVICLFRNLSTITWVLFALILGMLWLAGLVLGLDLKINFLNFIALPITFGIGVDYGVNVFQRYRETGGKDIIGMVRHTGSAVGLCSFSTMVGYGSLLIAGNQGFVSFGLLAVAGEITCVIAAVVTLPALLLYRQQLALRKSQELVLADLDSAASLNS